MLPIGQELSSSLGRAFINVINANGMKARADPLQPEPSLIRRHSAGGLINATAARWRTNFGSFG